MTQINNFPMYSICNLRQFRVLIKDSQILTLPTTGVVVIPTLIENTIIVPTTSFIYADFSGGAYTFDDGASWNLIYGELSRYISGVLDIGPYLTTAAIQSGRFAIPFPNIGAGEFDGLITNSLDVATTTESVNTSILIKDDYNGVSNYGGGNENNYVIITTSYLLFDITSGLFI